MWKVNFKPNLLTLFRNLLSHLVLGRNLLKEEVDKQRQGTILESVERYSQLFKSLEKGNLSNLV